MQDDLALFRPAAWLQSGQGPRYEQLYRHLLAAITSGQLASQSQLPPERDLAELAEVQHADTWWVDTDFFTQSTQGQTCSQSCLPNAICDHDAS